MYKQILCLLVAVLALVNAAPVQETFNELPCLGKKAGQRIAHPSDPHKFLRCVEADKAWIETCPEPLFFNPHSEICDWDQEEKPMVAAVPEDVKNRPVLVKFKPRNGESDANMETTIIQEVPEGGFGNGDALLTIAPESPVSSTVTIRQRLVELTTVAAEVTTVPEPEPVVDQETSVQVIDHATTEHIPVFEATTTVRPLVAAVAPVSESVEPIVQSVAPSVESVAQVVESVTPEIPIVESVAPVVESVSPVVETQQPALVEQATETSEHLDVIELSTTPDLQIL